MKLMYRPKAFQPKLMYNGPNGWDEFEVRIVKPVQMDKYKQFGWKELKD